MLFSFVPSLTSFCCCHTQLKYIDCIPFSPSCFFFFLPSFPFIFLPPCLFSCVKLGFCFIHIVFLLPASPTACAGWVIWLVPCLRAGRSRRGPCWKTALLPVPRQARTTRKTKEASPGGEDGTTSEITRWGLLLPPPSPPLLLRPGVGRVKVKVKVKANAKIQVKIQANAKVKVMVKVKVKVNAKAGRQHPRIQT